MFKVIRARIPREQILVDDVLCNACGKSTKDSQGMNYEHATITASWGCQSTSGLPATNSAAGGEEISRSKGGNAAPPQVSR